MSIKINKKNIFSIIVYLILLIPFFKPAYFNYIDINNLSSIYNLLKIVSIAVVILLTIFKNRYSKINLYILLYYLILIGSTVINQGDLAGCMTNTIQVVILCMLVDYGLKYDSKNFLRALGIILKVLVYINFITLILYPSGLYFNTTVGTSIWENWFLGYDNIHILYILPAIIIDYIYTLTFNSGKFKLNNIIFLLVAAISIYIRWSATSVVGFTLILFYMLFKKVLSKMKLFNIKTYTVSYISAFFAITIFKIQNMLSFFIVDVLGKDITFTGRTFVWDSVIGFIKMKPLLGYGVEEGFVRLFKTASYRVYHAHNQLLEIIYKSGFIGLIVFIIVIFSSLKQLYINRTNEISKFLSWSIFTYFVLMLTEAFTFEYILFIFVIGYNVEALIKQNKEVGALLDK